MEGECNRSKEVKEVNDAKASGDNNFSSPSGSRFIKPTPAEVEAYAGSIGYELDGGEFCDFYASKGWMVGKSPMRDWQASVRTWKRKNNPEPADTWQPPTIEELHEDLRRADLEYLNDITV